MKKEGGEHDTRHVKIYHEFKMLTVILDRQNKFPLVASQNQMAHHTTFLTRIDLKHLLHPDKNSRRRQTTMSTKNLKFNHNDNGTENHDYDFSQISMNSKIETYRKK